jgi:hypothetical protein
MKRPASLEVGQLQRVDSPAALDTPFQKSSALG